jgi:hypothetical protein
MRRIAGATLALVVGVSGIAVAQDKPMSHMPPKVLAIIREYTKPGKAGTLHEKTESAFVQALTAAKWPTHYIGVESLSGQNRALFLTGYESFDAWEKDTLAGQKNKTMSAALDKAWNADGELLSETDGGAFMFREDYSLRPEVDIAHARYFEISRFEIKPGHDKDWDEIVKLVIAAYQKIPDTHWAAYQGVYGSPDGTYIVFNPMKSLAEVDKNFMANKDFEAAMGADGMKKLAELSAAAISTSQTNLFAFNPRMSYPTDEWVKADPEFWKVKGTAPAAAKKSAEKPAETH